MIACFSNSRSFVFIAAGGFQQYPGFGSGPAKSGGYRTGPEGANVFICNLPAECGDAELSGMFMPYGNILSSKVFIDKMTGLSKQFGNPSPLRHSLTHTRSLTHSMLFVGFISFDNPQSATNSIANMNGAVVSGRQLKVSLKSQGQGQGQSQTQPY